MTDHVWLCNVMSADVVTGGMESDIWNSKKDIATLGVLSNQKGLSVTKEMCPKRVWGGEHALHFNKIVDLFEAQGMWLLSSRAADIMRQFDLGGGALYPVSEGVYQKDNKTLIPGVPFFTWIFGNTKTAFLEQHSPKVRSLGPFGRNLCALDSLQRDDDVAVSSSAALVGPDVWVDPSLVRSVFLSSTMGDALVAGGMKTSLRLLRCRVL